MVRNALLVFALLSLAVTVFAEDPEAAIRATLDGQVAAWNRGDLEGFMEGYLRGEELVFTSGGRVRRGWETTLGKYRERYGGAPETMGRLSFDEIEVHLLGEGAAWVLGRWKLTWPDMSTEGGVFTLVMTKAREGWKVVHDHTSTSTD